ncbi:hypothetical protein [Ensifer aridi]|uniref:hypothetical protein n=1 Tax=Ensifer aridi TaxID=1708715 RepID=UPI001AED0146|nr:hypothetical protein [Ensifer aridi]
MATAATVYRDYETDGIPSSGNHKVRKSEIRALLAGYENIINAFLSTGGLIFSSKATLDASLAYAANTMAWVHGDATVANNGVYRKNGASGTGSWTRVADLPYSFILATDAGAGTPNAIQATSSIPVSESALIIMNVFEANTASPVTVSFNGGSALTIKTNTGNDIATGGLVAGMIVLGIVSGTTFRLVSDQASSAIVAAAEAAQVAAEAAKTAAEAAAAGVNLPPLSANTMLVDTGAARENRTFPQVRALLSVPVVVESLAAAQAIDPAAERTLIMRDGTRDGLFFWHPENLSALVIKNSITTTSVNDTTDECTLVAHGFMTGNSVRTATAVNGLAANTLYYVIRTGTDSFKLASSVANAFAGTAVDLTGTTNMTLARITDPTQAVFIIPNGKATDGSQGAYVRHGHILTPQMFGAKADFGVTYTNDHDAIQLWFQTLLCLDDFGYQGELHGRYYLTRNLLLQPTELTTEDRGLQIRAAARNHDGFYFQNGFRFEISNPNAQAIFYFDFQARIVGNINNSQLVTIGISDFSDAYNSCTLDFIINNGGTGTTKALVINGMYQSKLRVIANGSASGRPIADGGSGPSSTIAAWLRQVQFTDISLASGNAGTGLFMSDGYCFGNTFDGTLDIEEVDLGVVISGANVYDNNFLGGTIVATKSFNCTAGQNNKAEGVNIGTGYTGWTLFVAGGERISVRSRAIPQLATSGLIAPTSGTLWRNTTGRKLCIRIEGTITAFTVTKAEGSVFSLGGLGAGYPVTIELDAYDGFTATFTGTPSFTYFPVG